MDQLLPFGNWFWWIAAGLLLIMELIAPGVFFMFLAGAALTVGILDTALSLGWQIELMLFAGFSLVFVLAGRPFLKKRRTSRAQVPIEGVAEVTRPAVLDQRLGDVWTADRPVFRHLQHVGEANLYTNGVELGHHLLPSRTPRIPKRLQRLVHGVEGTEV